MVFVICLIRVLCEVCHLQVPTLLEDIGSIYAILILARLLTNTAVTGTNHSLSTNGLFDANTAGDRFDR